MSTSKADKTKRYVGLPGLCITIPGLTAQISHPGTSQHTASICCDQHQSYITAWIVMLCCWYHAKNLEVNFGGFVGKVLQLEIL